MASSSRISATIESRFARAAVSSVRRRSRSASPKFPPESGVAAEAAAPAGGGRGRANAEAAAAANAPRASERRVVVVVVVRAGGDGAGSAGSARSRDAVGATRPEEASGESRRSADAEIVADLAARGEEAPDLVDHLLTAFLSVPDANFASYIK